MMIMNIDVILEAFTLLIIGVIHDRAEKYTGRCHKILS